MALLRRFEGPARIHNKPVQAYKQVMHDRSQRIELHLRAIERVIPGILKNPVHIIFFAIQTTGRFPAGMAIEQIEQNAPKMALEPLARTRISTPCKHEHLTCKGLRLRSRIIHHIRLLNDNDLKQGFSVYYLFIHYLPSMT